MPLPRDLDDDEDDLDLDEDEDFDDEDDDDLDEEDDEDEEGDDANAAENAHFLSTLEGAMDPKSKPLTYTMTTDSISVVGDGGKVYNIQRGAPNFAVVRQAIERAQAAKAEAESTLDVAAGAAARVRQADAWATVRDSLEVRQSVQTWANARFTFNAAGTALLFDGREVPESINRRVLAMVAAGESPAPLFNFYERLSRNPSWRSVQQLYTFLQHMNIPLLPDGRFLAYKGVNMDFTDCHSGTFVNKPGAIHRMPRNEISDDPNTACHVGFHVGALSYAQDFGPRVVVCRVDPEHVVCVPYDESARKMRVCEYEVMGLFGQELPSEVFKDPLPVSTPVVGATKEAMAGDEFDTFLDSPMLDKLLDMEMDRLRDVAVNKYKIIGAGHIQGGKAVLVAVIMEARSRSA